MDTKLRMGCVVMAAGRSERFGSEDKLMAELEGRPLLAYCLEAVQGCFARTVVIVSSEEAGRLAASMGFYTLPNPAPERGLCSTIAIGLREMAGMEACMFLVADQPMLRRETIAGMTRAYPKGRILVAAHGGRTGNPAIFPRDMFGELSRLAPGESGSDVMARHMDRVERFEVQDAEELCDIDTRGELERAAG